MPGGASQDAPYVSTGRLPERESVQRLVDEAHELYRDCREGRVSQAYPALARVTPELFGVCVVSTRGVTFTAGDADHQFAIMSVSKPFVFALICGLIGPAQAREKLGVNSTGLPFNSLSAVERGSDGRTNPMVNAGAIAATSLWLESNTPVAYSAIAAPSATISGGKRFHTNSTTTRPSTKNVIALSLTALAPPSRVPGHPRSDGDSNGDVAPPRL